MKMIDVGAGVVDYDYRGPVGVVLFNHGPEDFIVKRGDRVAQLILERICMADVEEVIRGIAMTRSHNIDIHRVARGFHCNLPLRGKNRNKT